MNSYLLVFLGGGLGSVARFAISTWYRNQGISGFPYHTLTANIISSFILGAVATYFSTKPEQNGYALMIFLTAGFCGGFSTFSTFSLETFDLLRTGNATLALANISVNVILCLVMVYLGYSFFRAS